MPDSEKVIKGLECCINDTNRIPNCENCPYADGTCDKLNEMHRDALELLKAQEARVLTLEEVDEYSEPEEKYSESEKQTVYAEYSNETNRPWAWRWLTVDMLHSWLDNWEMRIVYGKDWRCWTSRPTEEQRKAAKWDEDD